uniref:Mediator complex subunit 15 KIX domain-containing protein n=1 Tax=Aegilops tauschii subsp. strangulata TaxID=200361 RepID=A0A453RTM3_AEGTS
DYLGMETLKKHLPVSVPEGLNELQKIAVRFEEKIYTAATNQSDYLRKISLKMLSMETKTQQAPGNAQVIPNQNNSGKLLNPERYGKCLNSVVRPPVPRSNLLVQ